MPVHVDHEDIERRVVLAEAADDLFDLLIAVGPVARPPRAEGEARRQRNAAGDAHIVAERLVVVVAVAEEVPVLPCHLRAAPSPTAMGCFRLARKRKSAESKSGRLRIVLNCPSGARDKAVPDRFLRFVAQRAVQRARGALQILRINRSRPPDDRLAVDCERDGEIV